MRSPEDFKRVLERRPLPVIGDGFTRVAYPAAEFDLRGEAEKHVVAGKFTNQRVPLETLHRHVKRADQELTHGPLSNVSTNIADTVATFAASYRRLVKYLAREVFGYDLLFEKDPVLRFHFPVAVPGNFRADDGTLLLHHSDTLWGDPFELINCWVPLTRSFGTAALLLAPLRDSIDMLSEFCGELGWDEAAYVASRKRWFQKLCSDRPFRSRMLERCRPVAAEYGEILLFDPRSCHGTDENKEDLTRVSLDFRVIPLSAYEELDAWRSATGTSATQFGDVPFVRGEWFDASSAFQLP